jgi:tRNA1Val (adenine37-N6)-methyltransferase
MMADIDEGTLLGGRLSHRQLRDGHRTGIEPVLLAAAVPARPGERVLEAGTGSGAGVLCLAARIPGLRGTGIERDPKLAQLARDNAARNGFDAVDILCMDIAAFRTVEPYDHAFANPPWHDAAGTPSPDGAREAAKRGAPGLLASWATALAKCVRHHGTVTFVVVAGVLPDCIAALTRSGCGSIGILPLWPRPGAAAKLVIVQARRAGRAPARLTPGLVLHEDGAFTRAAQDVLRDGAGLTV